MLLIPDSTVANSAAHLVSGILGVYGVISSIEMLSRRHAFGPGGLLSWDALSLNFRQPRRGLVAKGLSKVYSYKGTHVVLAVRAAASLFLVVGFPWNLNFFMLAVIVFSGTNLLLSHRNCYGNDGADQMAMITGTALSIGFLAGSRTSIALALLFIAFQVQLAYMTSGTAKFLSRKWRNGTGLQGVIATNAFGNSPIRMILVRNRHLAQVSSWAVMITLILFTPLVWLGSGSAILALGLCGIFHIFNAVVMRLHTFVWAFSATYPAVWFAREYAFKLFQH